MHWFTSGVPRQQTPRSEPEEEWCEISQWGRALYTQAASTWPNHISALVVHSKPTGHLPQSFKLCYPLSPFCQFQHFYLLLFLFFEIMLFYPFHLTSVSFVANFRFVTISSASFCLFHLILLQFCSLTFCIYCISTIFLLILSGVQIQLALTDLPWNHLVSTSAAWSKNKNKKSKHLNCILVGNAIFVVKLICDHHVKKRGA